MGNSYAVYGLLIMAFCGASLHILWLICLQICKNKGIILNNIIRLFFSLLIIVIFFVGYFLAGLMAFRMYLFLGCVAGMGLCHLAVVWLKKSRLTSSITHSIRHNRVSGKKMPNKESGDKL